jgi:hypothetical protein
MSRGPYARVDWEDLAFEKGYPGPEAMLRHMYVVKEMTQEEIGLELNIHNRTVGLEMKRYGIPVRVRQKRKPGQLRGPRQPRRGV